MTVICRTALLAHPIRAAPDRVEAYRVELPPGQPAGRHAHPGPVTGYVERGRIAFERDGQMRTANSCAGPGSWASWSVEGPSSPATPFASNSRPDPISPLTAFDAQPRVKIREQAPIASPAEPAWSAIVPPGTDHAQ